MAKTFEEPYMELYLWAIFTAKVDLVEFFWAKLREPLVASVITAAIYSRLAEYYKKARNLDTHDKVTYEKNVEFQERANEVRKFHEYLQKLLFKIYVLRLLKLLW